MKRLTLAAFLLVSCGIYATAQENREGAAQAEGSGDKDVVWKWANFALLAAGLGYLMSKNLPVFFRSRTQEIQKGIAEAQEAKREAEKRATTMDARMGELGAEIERFREQAHAEMEREGARIRQETSNQVEKLQRQGEQEIESAGKAARRDLKKYAAELALDLAEQRIRTRLDAAIESGLVDDFLKELERQGARN
jgi:F-type H+-transporting ATPase subunit b